MAAPTQSRLRTRNDALLGYGAAGALPIAVSLGMYSIGPGVDPPTAAMLYLLGVLAAAAALGIGPGLTAAVIAAGGYNFLFLEPRFTLRISQPLDLVAFGVFLAVAVTTGWLAGRARDNERRAADRSLTTELLLEASRALAGAATVDEAVQTLVRQLAAAGAGSAVVFVSEGSGLRLAGAPGGVSTLAPDALAGAEAIMERRASDAVTREWRFTPLAGVRGRIGAVGLRKDQTGGGLSSALIEQGGVAIERAMLADTAAEIAALREADRLRTAVLNSISHDFRTPLASILGSATTLSDYEEALSPSVRRDLLASIQQDAGRLNAFIGALLDMARLEGGALEPAREWIDVRETLGSALRRLQHRFAGRRLEREFASSLSLVRADPILLEQAVLNLLDNAGRLTPPRGAIRVAAQEDARNVLVVIDDEGPGIQPQALDNLFDRFRRTPPGDGGLGLGLSIAKGFVEAMGGRLAATSPLTPAGGARFVISLPKTVETPKGML